MFTLSLTIDRKLMPLFKDDILHTLTSKHPNFCEGHEFIGKLCVCRVDTDPIAKQWAWTVYRCIEGIHGIELFVTDIVVSQVFTSTNANFKVMHQVICKVWPIVTRGVSILKFDSAFTCVHIRMLYSNQYHAVATEPGPVGSSTGYLT